MDDADIELAVKPSLIHASLIVGKCVTVQKRVYVQKSIYDQFVNRLGEAMQAVQFW